MTSRTLAIFTLILGAALLTVPALAGVDGSRPLVCSLSGTDECEDEGSCVEGDADQIRAPSFVRIDVKGRKIRVLDEGREDETTDIEGVERQAGRIILFGAEAGRGWSMVISEETGEITVSVSDDGSTMAAFGACIAM
jgi:hypothetical protein